MKKSITLIAFFLAFAFVNAQGPSVPDKPRTQESSSISKKNIKINVNKDRKLILKIDNDRFDMKITFPKKYVKLVRKEFLKKFKNSGDNYIWNGDDPGTKVKMHRNRININFLKEEISAKEMVQIKGFTEDVLDQIDWDVETSELWE